MNKLLFCLCIFSDARIHFCRFKKKRLFACKYMYVYSIYICMYVCMNVCDYRGSGNIRHHS